MSGASVSYNFKMWTKADCVAAVAAAAAVVVVL